MPQSMGELEYETQSRNHEKFPLKKKEKKWTLGSLFRRKKSKESDTDSSDSDAAENGKKRGFLARRRKRRSGNRGSKDVSQSFEHVNLRSGGGSISSDGSRKSLKARVEANRDSLLKDSSSEEERSPRPRAPRSKRSSKDMSDCHMKVMELDSSPRSPRWTAKVVYCESSDYEARYTARTRSATPSPAQSPIARVKHLKRPPIPQPNVSRPLNCQKSASFDLLPRQTQQQYNPHPRVPPPPPPRDPQRKIIPPVGYQQHDRPLSYAFESNQPIPKVMTDHNSNITAYKINSSCSLDNQPVYKINSTISLDHQSNYKMDSSCSLDQPSHRVNSSRSLDQPVSHVNGTGSWDKRRTYQYYTDQQPRSRRPIHITRVDQPYLSDSQVGRIRMNDWRIPRDSNSSLYDSSDSREGGMDARPLSMVVETTEQLPLRQPSPQQQQIQQDVPEVKEQKRKSSNLEDALNELEAIYKSLQLRDEEPSTHRGFESDSGYNYRVIDDMAYRRLNRRDSGGSPDCRQVMSQAGSYLLVSPTLSPPPFVNAPPIQTPINEPDITLDDVVYRSIRHTNNTLRINDPQPPFGIPLGPIAPGAGSDYLHAAPKQLYRPTFKPRKTPDIVKDDLAYRNLRKDGQQDSLLSTEDFLSTPEHSSGSILKKKRAVRSLSANLLSIIQKEQFGGESPNDVNYMDFDKGNFYEKTQSYSNLPDVLNSRYKRLTDDADVTPRASRLYSDTLINTTSTETLTDSRANIMNAHDSPGSAFNKRYPYLPVTATNKLLPKTQIDLVKLRLPNSQQISPPKKYLQNLEDNLTTNRNSQVYPQNVSYSTNYGNNYSSPNNSLKAHPTPVERTNSKSPSPYYGQMFEKSDNSTTVAQRNENEKLLESPKPNAGVRSSKFQEASPVERQVQSGFPSSKTVRGSYSEPVQIQTEHKRLSNPRTNKQFVSDSNRADIDNLKLLKHQPSSNGVTVNSMKSQVPFVSVSSRTLPQSSYTDDYLVSTNSPQKSSNLSNESNFNKSNLLLNNISTSNDKNIALQSTPVKSSNDDNCSSPKESGKSITIEGIRINMTPTSKTKSLKENTYLNAMETKPQKSTLSVNKPKVSNPRVTVSHHEKSHLKNDGKTTRANQEQSSTNGNGNGKHSKPVARPRTTINVIENASIIEKTKSSTPNSTRLSVTPEKDNVKQKVPSPNLSLNTEEKTKSKSASPRLSVKSSSSDNLKPRLPSPRSSVTPEKSQSKKRIVVSNSLDDAILDLSSKTDDIKKDLNDKNHPGETAGTSVKPRQTQFTSNRAANETRRKLKGKSLSLNSGLSVDIESIKHDNKPRLTKATSLHDSLHSETSRSDFELSGNHEENLSSSVMINQDYTNINKSSPSLSIPSPIKNINSPVKNANDSILTSNSNNNSLKRTRDRAEKDLGELLTEINLKQDEILAGVSTDCKSRADKSVSSSELTLNSNFDKRDLNSSILGKITPHKPVILTTFSIGENDTIKNSKMVVAQNDNEDNIIGTSGSMTDLLRELTRSLDQDFGGYLGDSNECHYKNVAQINRGISEKCAKEQTGKRSDNFDGNRTENDIDDDELTVDEADNEVMEINRKALSEIERNNKIEQNKHNPDYTKEVNVASPQSSIDVNVNNEAIFLDEVQSNDKSENVTQPIAKSSDYNSDDSNAEFVEAICQTASEISALSANISTTVTNPLANASRHHHVTGTELKPPAPSMIALTSSSESSRWNRQTTSCDLDRNEGIIRMHFALTPQQNTMYIGEMQNEMYHSKDVRCTGRPVPHCG